MIDSASPLTSALEQLRLKLLDLTGRNRLINFKHTAGKSLQFVEGHPAAIYQKLVEANNKANISILGLPEPARRDWVERNGRLQRPEPRDWAKASPPPGRNGARVDDRTEMVLLNYLMPQQRPRMPVRKILTRAGGSIQALKPCFMMGPQAVAQYLAPGVIKFAVEPRPEESQGNRDQTEASAAWARGQPEVQAIVRTA